MVNHLASCLRFLEGETNEEDGDFLAAGSCKLDRCKNKTATNDIPQVLTECGGQSSACRQCGEEKSGLHGFGMWLWSVVQQATSSRNSIKKPDQADKGVWVVQAKN